MHGNGPNIRISRDRNKERGDIRSLRERCSSEQNQSGYNSHESPGHTFTLNGGKTLQRRSSEIEQQSSHMNDSKSKSQSRSLFGTYPQKTATANKKESESVQSIKNFRKQEVLLGINQKVKQLNQEFERTLLFAN